MNNLFYFLIILRVLFLNCIYNNVIEVQHYDTIKASSNTLYIATKVSSLCQINVTITSTFKSHDLSNLVILYNETDSINNIPLSFKKISFTEKSYKTIKFNYHVFTSKYGILEISNLFQNQEFEIEVSVQYTVLYDLEIISEIISFLILLLILLYICGCIIKLCKRLTY